MNVRIKINENGKIECCSQMCDEECPNLNVCSRVRIEIIEGWEDDKAKSFKMSLEEV